MCVGRESVAGAIKSTAMRGSGEIRSDGIRQ